VGHEIVPKLRRERTEDVQQRIRLGCPDERSL
jgi:hypothetical protein